MHIAICDDEALYREAVGQMICRWISTSGNSDTLLSLFSSSEELLEQFNRSHTIDLLFLDIKVPGELDGINLAKEIRKINSNVQIVFITNYDEFVYEGYTVNALRYLRKPILEEDVFFCCSYVYNRTSLQKHECILLQSGNKRLTIKYAEILYAEIKSHSLYVFTTRESTPIKLSLNLSDFEERLPSKLFALCHRSYIVNLSRIRLLTRTRLVLTDGTSLPVSRTYSEKLNKKFDTYFQGGRINNGLEFI